jgi:hypothetical protein
MPSVIDLFFGVFVTLINNLPRTRNYTYIQVKKRHKMFIVISWRHTMYQSYQQSNLQCYYMYLKHYVQTFSWYVIEGACVRQWKWQDTAWHCFCCSTACLTATPIQDCALLLLLSCWTLLFLPVRCLCVFPRCSGLCCSPCSTAPLRYSCCRVSQGCVSSKLCPAAAVVQHGALMPILFSIVSCYFEPSLRFTTEIFVALQITSYPMC